MNGAVEDVYKQKRAANPAHMRKIGCSYIKKSAETGIPIFFRNKSLMALYPPLPALWSVLEEHCLFIFLSYVPWQQTMKLLDAIVVFAKRIMPYVL